jgi:hypothetical protein
MFDNLGPKEAVYYLTMMVVTGLVYVGLERLGVQGQILRLVIALVLGVGAGWLAERAYTSRRKER